jgi:site-specific DNA recombinase
MGDDSMHNVMRQIMALFDEYQSKGTAKHVLRAMHENARQGFWETKPGAVPTFFPKWCTRLDSNQWPPD